MRGQSRVNGTDTCSVGNVNLCQSPVVLVGNLQNTSQQLEASEPRLSTVVVVVW